MTIEMFNLPKAEAQTVESLEQRLSRERIDIQRDMSALALIICEAQSIQLGLLKEMLDKNEEIRAAGFDVTDLAAELYTLPNKDEARERLQRMVGEISSEPYIAQTMLGEGKTVEAA